MKKILALVLVLGLMCTFAMAETYDQEILFREIP